MMLSKVDFEDLFPDLFPADADAAAPSAQAARVEAPAQPMPLAERAIQQPFSFGWPGMVMAQALAANMSAVAANPSVNRPRAA